MTIMNFLKDPDAVLDYVFDWSDWLADGETISSHEISIETGITKDSDSADDDSVTVWLSGGTAGEEYTVACKIVTSDSRTDERSMNIMTDDR